MIFVTVGTELPFDRLVRVVDDWAQATGRSDVFAQLGRSDYRPHTIGFQHFLEAPEYRRHMAAAQVVISHAGMGTILTGLCEGKRLLVMPRRASLGEHRNEHQLATAHRWAESGRVAVAFDEDELRRQLAQLEDLVPPARLSPYANPELLEALRSFIATRARPAPTPAPHHRTTAARVSSS